VCAGPWQNAVLDQGKLLGSNRQPVNRPIWAGWLKKMNTGTWNYASLKAPDLQGRSHSVMASLGGFRGTSVQFRRD